MYNFGTTILSIIIGYFIVAHIGIAGVDVGKYSTGGNVAELAQAGIECTISLVMGGLLITVWLANICSGIKELRGKFEKEPQPLERRSEGTEDCIRPSGDN